MISRLVVAVVLIAGCGPVSAQVDRDPFRPLSPAELVELADRDRVERLVTALVEKQLSDAEERLFERLAPRLDAAVQQGLLRLQQAVTGDAASTRDAIARLSAELPDLIAVELERLRAEGSAALAPEEPEGASFVACINGRALYRDLNGSVFQVDETLSRSRCG